MFAGLDVRDAVDPVLQQDEMKSNVMSVGYEDGPRLGIGCQRPVLGIEALNKVESAVEIFTAPPLVRLADGSQFSGEIFLKPREKLSAPPPTT